MEERKLKIIHSAKIKKQINDIEKDSHILDKNSKRINLDFLMLKYKRKGKNKFEIDFSDERLKDLYINSEFFIDPLHPYYQKYNKLKQLHEKMINKKELILKQKISLCELIKKLKS